MKKLVSRKRINNSNKPSRLLVDTYQAEITDYPINDLGIFSFDIGIRIIQTSK